MKGHWSVLAIMGAAHAWGLGACATPRAKWSHDEAYRIAQTIAEEDLEEGGFDGLAFTGDRSQPGEFSSLGKSQRRPFKLTVRRPRR